MKNDELSEIIEHWVHIAKFIGYPKNDRELDKWIARLDRLLDIVGKNEKHKLIGLVDFFSYVIEKYEAEHYPEQESPTGIDALMYLMKAHNLSQSDLPEIGSQGVVSEILSGKRSLNLRQIRALSKRFAVDVSTFIDEALSSESSGPQLKSRPTMSASK
jgi:HTH-type transcriptional regulator/antitoxin HigA